MDFLDIHNFRKLDVFIILLQLFLGWLAFNPVLLCDAHRETDEKKEVTRMMITKDN